MADSPVKGIIFDLDGTLYRMRRYLRPLIALGVFPQVRRLIAFMAVRQTFAGRHFGSRQELMQSIADGMAAELHTPSTVIADWIETSFNRAFIGSMRFFRNSRYNANGLMDEMHRRSIRLAVLSDYGRVAERLDRLKIKRTPFDILASCEDSGALKPHPLAYEKIAAQWTIAPQNMLVIGDRIDTDGAAAHAAGMAFWQVIDTKKQLNGPVDKYVPAKRLFWHEIVARLSALQ